jgi:hypothetical protein
MQNVKEEIAAAVTRMIDLIDSAVEEAEEMLREAHTPSLFDLRAACAYRGGESYDVVRKANYKRPLCGYYTHWEDTPQRRKPMWTSEQVERWATVTKPQRAAYAEELLYGDEAEISAGVLHMLITDIDAGVLPEYLRDVVDEYVETVKGRAV